MSKALLYVMCGMSRWVMEDNGVVRIETAFEDREYPPQVHKHPPRRAAHLKRAFVGGG